jgi:hypothetical protein
MKLPTFRRDSAAGLATARGKLAAAEARLADLANERALALAESDDVAVVQKIDTAISAAQSEAGVLKDRISTLQQAIRQQQVEETERQRQAALVEVQKRLDAQVELATDVEAAVKQLGAKWNELLNWRTAILGAWPDGLPRPLASDFEDVRLLRRELATALFSASKPAWDRQPSIPAPASPIGVQGLEPTGIAGYVAAAGAGFLARIKAQRINGGVDDENTTEAA